MKLTHREILNATPGEKDRYLSDSDGLRLRIRPSGAKSFEVRYHLDGKKHAIRIGSFPETGLKAARARAFEIRRMVDNGLDPKLERRKDEDQRRAESLEKTVAEVYADWMESYIRVQRRRPDIVEDFMSVDVLPFIGKVRAKDIQRHHVVQIVERIVQRGAMKKADEVLKLARQMLSHGVAKGFLPVHPCPDLVRKHFKIPKHPSRSRYLSEAEIVELFQKLPESGLSERMQAAIRILLATGVRTGELRQARWADVDFDSRLWTIPPDNAKNAREHLIHLSDFAIENFKILREYSVGKLVLCNYRDPDRPIERTTLAKQIRDRQRETPLENRAKNHRALLL